MKKPARSVLAGFDVAVVFWVSYDSAAVMIDM